MKALHSFLWFHVPPQPSAVMAALNLLGKIARQPYTTTSSHDNQDKNL